MGSQKYDVKTVDGTPQLQKNGPRGFYMQVQLCMFCTGLRASDAHSYRRKFACVREYTSSRCVEDVQDDHRTSQRETQKIWETLLFLFFILYIFQWPNGSKSRHSDADQPETPHTTASTANPWAQETTYR
ncbi:hypothetical protein SRHO_G00304290 [Serrasalmus rhombeus]